MNEQLKRLWHCWIADRSYRKPYWSSWARLLAQLPLLREQVENVPYFQIYKDRLENGQYTPEPPPRGKWVGNKWVLRSRA